MKKIIVIAIMGVSIIACKKEDLKDDDGCTPSAVSFMDDVQPIFTANCSFSYCHSSSGQANGISLDTYANVTGTANEAQIIGAINHDSGFENMPKGGSKLDQCLIETIETWYAEGAKDN